MLRNPYPLLKQSSTNGHSLLQVLDLSLMLRISVDLDLTLICIQQLKFLLQLHLQCLILCLLGLVQSQLKKQNT